jgi:tetratricopeptide (TPR) repeat protein
MATGPSDHRFPGPDTAALSRDAVPASGGQPAHRYALVPGDVLQSRYRITAVIGRGGMGEVYAAWDENLRESIAIKTLRADLARDHGITRRFHKEIHLARKVTHPNVCRIFETGAQEGAGVTHDPLPFFTMELLRGETLGTRIHREGRLRPGDAFPIAEQMAEGLFAAHQAGVIHADFKSGNVMLVAGPHGRRAVITDFGLARVEPSNRTIDDTRTMDSEQRLAGTVAYMSPEQIGGGAITAASDIYSLGVVLFEMATGRLPFDARHPVQAALERLKSGHGPAVRELAPDLDPRWEHAIQRCLRREPAERFASARDLADQFRQAARPAPRRAWGRRKWLAAAAAGAVSLGAAGSGLWIWRHPYRPKPSALGWYREGLAALHSMTYETARRAFEQAVAADPEFALAHAGLARAYQELDYTDLARESMLKALAAAEESRLSSDDSLRLHAVQFLVSRDYPRAAPLLHDLERRAAGAEQPAAALETGWLAQQQEDTEAAAAAYTRALRLDPAYAAAKLRLGYILGRRRQVADALRTLEEAEQLYKASSSYEGVTQTLYEEAMLLNRSSRSAEAMPAIEKALAVARTVDNPYQQIRVQLAQGVAYRNLGDPARATGLAQQAIDAAIARDMDNLATSGLIDLGNSYMAVGDLARAEPLFRKALALAGKSRVRRSEARARLSLASLCEQERRPAEARQFVEAALPFAREAGYRREFVQAMTILGGVHAQQAQFEDSIRVLREALDAAGQLHDKRTEDMVRERLAESLRDEGLWPEALRVVESLLPSRGAWALISRGDLCRRMGLREEARRALAEAASELEKNPNRQLLFELRLGQAALAHQEGRLADAAASAGMAPAVLQADVPRSRLIGILAAIRRAAQPDLAAALSLVENFDREGLAPEAAAARLEIAAALLAPRRPAAPARDLAERLATESLAFFEPRRIWEGAWRGHALAARASRDAASAHRAAARSAFDCLRALWPAATFESYLERPDIRPLAAWKEEAWQNP